MDRHRVHKTEGQSLRLPLSSLRLLVPPLHLMCAFMWQVMQQKVISHYGKLEEFVSVVTECVPHLLSYRQRAQLLLGLRARMVLEKLQGSADAKVIKADLDKMLLPAIPVGCSVSIDSDLEVSVSNFKALVVALLKDPAEKAYFFQAVFPVQYGLRYDAALKELMWELLSCLERLLPVPDFKKTLSWLTPSPPGLDECMQAEAKYLQVLLQQHEVISGVDNQHRTKGSTLGSNLRSTSGDCILSSLSIPPSTHVAVTTEPMVYHIQPSTVTILSQSALAQLGSDAIIVTDYTEVELSSNGAAEESHEGCVLMNASSSPTPQAISDEDAIEEEEIITSSEHAELYKNPEGDKESEEEKNYCEKSTQCDIRAEPEPEGGGHDDEVKDEMEVMPNSDVLQKDDGQPSTTPTQDKSSPSAGVSQAAPAGRRRGRPRKDAAARKEVQNGRRRGRPPSQKADKANSDAQTKDVGGNKEGEPKTQETSPTSAEPRITPGPKTVENPRARYVCETCGRKFTRTSDVRRHQLTHTGERPFRCSYCEKTFQHAWDLTKHCRKFHGEATFSCSLCSSQFVNLRALTAHHKQSHAADLPHYCSICGQASASAADLVQHRKLHSVTHQYWCEQCGEGFDTLLQRSVHRRSHRLHRKFKCPQCDKAYSRRSDVKRHSLSHTGERPHQCGLCGKSFVLRSGLQKHQLVHSGTRPFRCPHCPKAFSLLSVCRRHERMHTGERPYLCSQCGKCFLSLGELVKHDKSHTDARPHACGQCQKSFKSKRALQAHVVSHSGTRPYPCTYCGKKFTKVFALNRHHMMHTGERPFSCPQCDRTFLTSGELALHERVHTGERPYACPDCDWTFRSSSELGRHRRTHGQQMAHACSYCPKTYTTTSKLKKHMRVHTGEAQTKCPVEISHTVEVPASALHDGLVTVPLS